MKCQIFFFILNSYFVCLEDSRNEDSTLKTGGRRSTEKPDRMVYRPHSGMTIKRSEPSGNESWRTNKSPSPSPAELHVKNRRNKNRQVENNHKDNRDLDLKISSNSSQEKEMDQKMKELTISTEEGHVIDLTVSPNPSSEERKKTKKPEQAIYVPKSAIQEQKPTKLDWAAEVEEFGFEEDVKQESRDKSKSRKKPKRRTGAREEKDRHGGDPRNERSYGRPEETERDANKSQSNVKTETREVRQVSEPRYPPGGGRGAPHPRARDTRSMEHGGWSGENQGWSGDRNSSKPPAGRPRGPSLNYETLPPRLKKKFLEEQGLGSSAAYSEEPWDGGSMSFSSHQQGPPPQQWTNTVPPPRGRGRGRGRTQEAGFADRRPGDSWNNDRWSDQRKERDVNGVGRPELDLRSKIDAARSKQSKDDVEMSSTRSKLNNDGPDVSSARSKLSADDVGSSSARSKLSEDSWKDDGSSGRGQSSSSGPLASHR